MEEFQIVALPIVTCCLMVLLGMGGLNPNKNLPLYILYLLILWHTSVSNCELLSGSGGRYIHGKHFRFMVTIVMRWCIDIYFYLALIII